MRRWTIYDEKEGKEIRLTPRQIEIIKNIQNHRYAEPGYNDETEYIPYFSGEVSVLPWSDREPPKSHFTPEGHSRGPLQASWARVVVIICRREEGASDVRYVGERGRGAQERAPQPHGSQDATSG